MGISHAKVTKAAAATNAPVVTIPKSACFLPIFKPVVQGGSMIVDGDPEKTHAFIYAPDNTEGEAIKVKSGSATIVGGISAGPIESTTTGSLKVAELQHLEGGTVQVSGSHSIFLSNVKNSGTVTVKESTATLIDIENKPKGKVTVESGTYHAFGIVNNGE